MDNKWFSFKLLSSFLLLIVTTIWSIMYDTSVTVLIMVTWNSLVYDDWAVWGDIWFCVWALCVVRFVDALDDIGDKR